MEVASHNRSKKIILNNIECSPLALRGRLKLKKLDGGGG